MDLISPSPLYIIWWCKLRTHAHVKFLKGTKPIIHYYSLFIIVCYVFSIPHFSFTLQTYILSVSLWFTYFLYIYVNILPMSSTLIILLFGINVFTNFTTFIILYEIITFLVSSSINYKPIISNIWVAYILLNKFIIIHFSIHAKLLTMAF